MSDGAVGGGRASTAVGRLTACRAHRCYVQGTSPSSREAAAHDSGRCSRPQKLAASGTASRTRQRTRVEDVHPELARASTALAVRRVAVRSVGEVPRGRRALRASASSPQKLSASGASNSTLRRPSSGAPPHSASLAAAPGPIHPCETGCDPSRRCSIGGYASGPRGGRRFGTLGRTPRLLGRDRWRMASPFDAGRPREQ